MEWNCWNADYNDNLLPIPENWAGGCLVDWNERVFWRSEFHFIQQPTSNQQASSISVNLVLIPSFIHSRLDWSFNLQLRLSLIRNLSFIHSFLRLGLHWFILQSSFRINLLQFAFWYWFQFKVWLKSNEEMPEEENLS